MSNISAAPIPVPFVTDEKGGSQTYLFAPLVDQDYTTVDHWLQGRYVENAINGIPKGLPQNQQDRLYETAVRSSLSITFFSEHGMAMLATLEGLAFLTWLSVRKNHPDFTQEQALQLLLLQGNLKAVNRTFAKVNAVPKNPRGASRQKSRAKR